MMRVLHIDDEADIREVAALCLEMDPGIEARSAASGREAIDLLNGDWSPDLILLDVMMPDLDGPGTLLRIRELNDYQKTPVIFMTARVQSHEQNRFLELGAIGVIVKPFDPMGLAQQVRDLMQARP